MDELPSPTSPVKGLEEAQRDEIIASLSRFLPPGTIQHLRTTSRGYESSISKLNKELEMKRRVEEILGRELPGGLQHDWERTYNLLMTDRTALYYSSDLDQQIAHELKVEVPKTTDELIGKMETAAEKGWTDVFKVLLKYLDASNYLRDTDYDVFIANALIHKHLAILDIPEMITAMENMSGDEIDENIEDIVNYEVPVNIVDFFLSNIPTEEYAQGYQIFRAISEGSIGLVTIFLKHGLIDPLEEVDGRGYVMVDYDADAWNPLQLAMRCGHLEMVKLFLREQKVKDAVAFDFLLTSTIANGHVDIVRLMLEDGRIAVDGNDLVVAVARGNVEMVRLLLTKVGNINYGEGHALRSAANNNRTEITLLLLQDPRLILNQKDKDMLIAIAKYNGNHRLERALRLYDAYQPPAVAHKESPNL